MRKLWKNLVVSVIFIAIAFVTVLITTYGFIVSLSLFGPLGAVVWLLLAATIVLTLVSTYMEDAFSKADEWVKR